VLGRRGAARAIGVDGAASGALSQPGVPGTIFLFFKF